MGILRSACGAAERIGRGGWQTHLWKGPVRALCRPSVMMPAPSPDCPLAAAATTGAQGASRGSPIMVQSSAAQRRPGAAPRLLHIHHAERGDEEGERVDGQRAAVLVRRLLQRGAHARRQRARDVGGDEDGRPVAQLQPGDGVRGLPGPAPAPVSASGFGPPAPTCECLGACVSRQCASVHAWRVAVRAQALACTSSAGAAHGRGRRRTAGSTAAPAWSPSLPQGRSGRLAHAGTCPAAATLPVCVVKCGGRGARDEGRACTRIIAPATSVTVLSSSQPGLQSATYGRSSDSCPTACTTAKPSASSFWYSSNCARPWARARAAPRSECCSPRHGHH